MNTKKSKELTRLERFWLAVGLLLFRVEGAPIEYRISRSERVKTAFQENAKAQ